MVPTQITESHSRALSHGASDRDAALALAPRHLLIDGRFVPVSGGRTLGVGDPATGRILAEVADATLGDCLAALEAAVAAQASWAGSAPRERSRILRHAADRLRDEIETLANILTAEMGKPLAESRAEVEFAADYLEWFGEEAVRVAGRTAASPDGHSQHLVVRTPVGPCLVITPWNFPLAVPARGIGPALAAGCTVVLRPSSLTPLSALALGRILIEAGLPAGVLNIVVSSEDAATDPLLRDGRIRKLTFTGSEAVGRHLIAQSAEQVLRVSAELGGCAPFVVFADADMDEAVEGAFAAKMRNGGAACTAANRFYIQRPIYAEFTRRLAARVAGVRIGRGTRAGVGLGPMISERHVARLAALVDDAVTRGARVVVAGGPVPGDGHFFTPVVLAEVPQDARVMREEIFGPVVAIAPFDTEDEALALANDHDAGPRRLPLHQRSGAGHAPRWGDPGGHGRHKPRPGQLRGGPLRRRRPLRLRPLRRGRGHRRVPGHPVPHDIDGGRAMSRGLTRHPVTIDEWRHPMLPMHRFHYLIRQAVLATLRAEADRHAQLLARIADAHPAACITGAASDEFAAFRGGRGRLVEEEVRVDLDCHGDLHPCGDGNQLRSSNRDPTGSNPTPIPEVSTMRPAAAVRSTCSSARPTAITTSTIGRSRVACLLDGADGAGALLAEGARRAADGGSSLSLIYVDVSLLTPLVCLDGFVWIPDPDAVEADVRGWLGELAMQYPQAEAVFLRGDPATEVAAWAESQRPEVLLVGRRGGRLRRLLLGDRSPACAEARAARLLRSAWTRQPGGHPPGLNAGRASRPLTQHCDRRARKIDRMVKLLNHQALLLGLDLRRSEPTGDVMFILDVPWREGRHGGRRPRRRRARAAGGVRRSPWPTTTTPASPPTSTPAIWSGRCAWIEAGMLAINRGRVSCVAAPFGGVGHSGFGHSGGPDGIEEYLVTRHRTMPMAGCALRGPDDPRPGYDWDSYRAARDRFFARVRPQSMRNPPSLLCPEGVPEEWTAEQEEPRAEDGD